MARSKKKNKTKKEVVIDEKTLDKRILAFEIVIVLLFIIVIFKLIGVMMLDSKKYQKSLMALSNNIIEGTSVPRGRILDRNHNVIVDNKAVKTIFYKKSKNINTKKELELAYTVSNHLNLEYDKVTDDMLRTFFLDMNNDLIKKRIKTKELEKYEQGKINKNELIEIKKSRITEKEINELTEEDKKAAYLYYLMNKGYTYDDKLVKTGDAVEESEYAYIAENTQELDGFSTKLDWERTYPYGETFRSMLGTVSTSSQGIPASLKTEYLNNGYSLNDRVGLSYLEKEYENYLKGTKEKYEVVNSHELKLVSDGKRGNDIVLTIDINLQQEVEKILEEEIRNAKNERNTEYYDHSSVVIEDPKTGEILAMSSKKIVGDEMIDNTATILSSPITPGSVVKGASMLVGYNTGVIKMGETILDECIKVAGAPQKCSSHTLGRINDITALAKSSNVYQFKTAIRVNGQEYRYGMKLNFNQKAFDTYREMYNSFGLGVKTGIDLPFESVGYSSTDKSAGNLLDFVMGQYETYTPIQLSQYIATIANDGERLAPHLLKEVHESSETEKLGKTTLNVEKKVLNNINTKPEYLKRVKEGFYAVIHAPGGYGAGYIENAYDGAGKTGTSQSFLDTDNDGVIDTETITSSFIGYAPASDPKMSMIVTSPDSSHPNTSSDFASLVTYRISKRISTKFFEMTNTSS